MSAQTRSVPPPGPLSVRLADRARFRFRLWESEPNPIWVRELRQSARLARTPIVLSVLVILMTLLIASVGGIVAVESSPATTGGVIFQVFFSVAYFVVALLGPAAAANSIASEREGRTWEAVILTGLAPATIARGKFLAAFTSIATYVVMLAPVGALSFLFGGVTATEVAVAFLALFAIALLGVAFGLAVSSKMASLRGAIVVTLLLAFPLSIVAFVAGGVWLSYAAHLAWPGVPEGPPIWLPSACERAPFGVQYALFLVLLPLLAVLVPAWLLYELTVANLTSAGDDRSTGLKRWFAFAAPALTLAAAIPIATLAAGGWRAYAADAGIAGLLAFLVGCVFLFLGDPIGPSRRVAILWERRRAGRLERFLGPGAMRSAALLLGVGAGCLAGLAAIGYFGSRWAPVAPGAERGSVLIVGGYALGFFTFVVGLGAYFRARVAEPLVARLLCFAMIFAVTVVPWVVAAMGGLIHEALDADVLVIAAPSPFYVLLMIDGASARHDVILRAGSLAMLGWAALGLLLLAAGARRARGIVRRREELLAEGDRKLAAEDEAARPPPELLPAPPAP